MAAISLGVFFALLFVTVRGGNSANYFMAKRELPDMALVAVTSLVSAIVAFALSLLFENPQWGKLLIPSSLFWTLAAGTLSVVSVYAALRSYDFIPQWLTQSFIGLEPIFGVVGLVLVSGIVMEAKTKQMLLSRLPSNWWFFFCGLLLVILGVVLMALSKVRLENTQLNAVDVTIKSKVGSK